MISKFIREQKRYTFKNLTSILECDEQETKRIIKKLKEYGVVKAVTKSDKQLDLSDLQNEDIEITSIEDKETDYYYIFTFVGILTIAGKVLKIYPKYILEDVSPIEKFKQILKVIHKFNSEEQIIKIFNDGNETQNFNLLATLLFFIHDYIENGAYQNSKNIIETNGNGEILWEKTINETLAILHNQKPFYTELKTKRTVNNNDSYIKNLYECVVTQVSEELKQAQILDLFDISPIELSNNFLNDFGDKEYILYRLEKELEQEFNTRKQLVLKALYTYIAHQNCIEDLSCFSMYGTAHFNLLWEKICSIVMNNMLNTKLSQLNLPKPLNDNFADKENLTLIDIIEKPYWSICSHNAKDTLIPDIITFCQNNHKNYFVILDAKYYCPTFKKNTPPKNQPGIDSITKQYLYNLAYKNFALEYSFDYIKNYFIMPTENNSITDGGVVELKMLNNLGLDVIKNKFIPAHIIFENYLNNTHFNTCEILD